MSVQRRADEADVEPVETRARDVATGSRRVGRVRHHPRAGAANLEELDRLAGIIHLTGPAPSARFPDAADEQETGDAGN